MSDPDYVQPDADPVQPDADPTCQAPAPKKETFQEWMVGLAAVLTVVLGIVGFNAARKAVDAVTPKAAATVTAPAVVPGVGLSDPLLLNQRVLADFRLASASDPTRYPVIDSVDCTYLYNITGPAIVTILGSDEAFRQVFSCGILATKADGSPTGMTITVTVTLDGSDYKLN